MVRPVGRVDVIAETGMDMKFRIVLRSQINVVSAFHEQIPREGQENWLATAVLGQRRRARIVIAWCGFSNSDRLPHHFPIFD